MSKTAGIRIRQIACPYCGVRMEYRGPHRIQLGRWGLFIEHWDHFLSGSLNVQIYECPKCGKIDMFRSKKTTKRKKQ